MSTIEVENEDIERLSRISEGIDFAVFGFGTEPLDFARRLSKLGDYQPADYDLLSDITERLVFINRLRFRFSKQSGDMNQTSRMIVDSNADALETYLLCTCIDAIAGGREYVEFPAWVNENMEELARELNIGVRHSLFTIIQDFFGKKSMKQDYFGVTRKLYEKYENAEAGLTRRFHEFFENLPPSLKEFISDRFIWIKGDFTSEHYQTLVKEWISRPTNEKMKRLARDYLYGFRRSKYTHVARLSDSTRPGWIRQAANCGTIPNVDDDPNSWQFATFEKKKRGKPQKYTLLVRSDTDENLVWRAVICTAILRDFLKYSISKEYVEALLRYYGGIDAIHAFVDQMEENWDWYRVLTTPRFLVEESRFLNYEISKFKTYTGKRLIEEFGDIIASTGLEGNISGYLHSLNSLNEIINRFDEAYPPGAPKKRQQALPGLATKLSVYDFSWHLRWVYSNLWRMMEDGGLHRHSNIVLVN